MRKMNDYVRTLKEVSDYFRQLLGEHIPVRNKCGFVEMRTITGVFEDDNLADNQLVFLLDNGRHIVKRYDEIQKDLSGIIARSEAVWK